MRAVIAILVLFLMAGAFFLGTTVDKGPENDQTEFVNGSMNGGDDNENIDNESGEEENLSANFTNLNQEQATIALFERSAPAVVYITTSSLQRDRWSMNIYEIPQGSGTGFLWDEDGHIVTNYHVIEGANRCMVTLSDQSSYEASVVGTEPSKDLAVLRIITPGQNLKPLPVGNSSKLKVGQSVFAIGNPFGLDQSLTTGIISALGREINALNNRVIKDVIQTDAAINPGNSGGPLLDSSGRLIGVNTAIYSPSGASAGIGFSIPVDVVKWVVPDLIRYGEVRRPILGVGLLEANQYSGTGAMLKYVEEGSPADEAGLIGMSQDQYGRLLAGDVILQIDNFEISDNNDLINALEKYKIGDEIRIRFKRGERIGNVSLKLASSIGR